MFGYNNAELIKQTQCCWIVLIKIVFKCIIIKMDITKYKLIDSDIQFIYFFTKRHIQF